MRETLRTGAQGAGSIALVAGLIVAAAALCFWLYASFAPRYAVVNNQVFHNSQQYNDGMVNRLEQYQEAYVTATTPEQKAAIRSLVRHDFASYDDSRLNADLRAFLAQMRGF